MKNLTENGSADTEITLLLDAENGKPLSVRNEILILLNERVERLEACIDGITDRILAAFEDEKLDRNGVRLLQDTARVIGSTVRSLMQLATIRQTALKYLYSYRNSPESRIRLAKKSRRKPGQATGPQNMALLKAELDAMVRGDHQGDLQKIFDTIERARGGTAALRKSLNNSAAC